MTGPREPVRFTAPHPLGCDCTFCRAWRADGRPAPGPGPRPAPRPRTPEDGQTVTTPEQGRPIATREAASGREVPNGADDRGPAGKD